MGQAVVQALNRKKNNLQVFVNDRRKKLTRRYNNLRVKGDRYYKHLPKSEIVLIAVKPQDIAGLANQIKGLITSNSIIVSIAAGVTVAKLSRLFRHQKIIRMMPNLGLSVGQGIAVWKAKGLSGREFRKAKLFINQITENFEVGNESLIDAATAISGSGPAYFFYLADALTNAALDLKLTESQARKLVGKTMYAAAFLQADQPYTNLINKIKSRKGTTEAALKVLNRNHAEKIIKSAVKAAFKRSRELSYV